MIGQRVGACVTFPDGAPGSVRCNMVVVGKHFTFLLIVV